MNSIEKFQEKQKTIGYESGMEAKNLNMNLRNCLNLLKKFPPNLEIMMSRIDEATLKSESKNFMDNYFDVHDVAVYNSKKNEMPFLEGDSDVVIQEKWKKRLEYISAYDLPIEYIDHYFYAGETIKLIPVSEEMSISFIEPIAFSKILLGDKTHKLSIATYIHELGHTQTESNKGYAKDFHNKEVISIFLEKLAACHLDSSGYLLKINEQYRLKHLYDSLLSLYLYTDIEKTDYQKEDEIVKSMYIESTLKAMKLFDIYQSLRKEKQRRKLLDQIQEVFDGKIQVEELLQKNGVTLSNSQSLTLIQKRMK